MPHLTGCASSLHPQAKDPLNVQPHLKKCFEGIKKLDMSTPNEERKQHVSTGTTSYLTLPCSTASVFCQNFDYLFAVAAPPFFRL